MADTLISIICVNYNGRDYLYDCINSIFNQEEIGYDKYELILIDNNSSDGSVEFVREQFKDVKIIRNIDNFGHAKACNIGAKNANGTFFIFIDNDTKFDHYWLRSLLDSIESDSNIGAVGCKVLDYWQQNIIQEIGIQKDRFGFPMPYHKVGDVDQGQYDKIREVFYCSSCAIIFRRTVFELIGGFDEDFFVHEDDFDICWRTWLAGYKVLVNPFSVLYHKKGGTTGGGGGQIKGKYKTKVTSRYYGEKNILCSMLKNYSVSTLILILPQYMVLLFGEMLIYIITKNFRAFRSLNSAILWNLTQLPNTLNKRRHIQNIRTIDDGKIKHMMIKGSAKWNMLKQIGLPKFE